jgi:hypothetical protein
MRCAGFFCIHGGRLLYFSQEVEAPAEDAPSLRGSLPLVGTSVSLDDEDGRTIRLHPANGSSPFLARALEPAEAEQWVWALYQSAAAAARMSGSAAAPAVRLRGSLFGGGRKRSAVRGSVTPVVVTVPDQPTLGDTG